mmetsp:Transcript_13159/g.11631  ORF Transcript_13159/g.11631 Transcript_13159/m.11631 type:complete len:93 (-) Transcript_13159:36-314(-)
MVKSEKSENISKEVERRPVKFKPKPIIKPIKLSLAPKIPKIKMNTARRPIRLLNDDLTVLEKYENLLLNRPISKRIKTQRGKRRKLLKRSRN